MSILDSSLIPFVSLGPILFLTPVSMTLCCGFYDRVLDYVMLRGKFLGLLPPHFWLSCPSSQVWVSQYWYYFCTGVGPVPGQFFWYKPYVGVPGTGTVIFPSVGFAVFFLIPIIWSVPYETLYAVFYLSIIKVWPY